MGLFLGWEAPLSNSVFAAAAAALLLAGATACGSHAESMPVAASATSTAAASPPQANILLQQALPNAAGKTFTSHVVAANASTTELAKLLVVYVSSTGDPLQANDTH